ncbi:hypothetical protein AHAS_Ahas02G0187000 [Arachis hypogaea]
MNQVAPETDLGDAYVPKAPLIVITPEWDLFMEPLVSPSLAAQLEDQFGPLGEALMLIYANIPLYINGNGSSSSSGGTENILVAPEDLEEEDPPLLRSDQPAGGPMVTCLTVISKGMSSSCTINLPLAILVVTYGF